MEKKSHTLINHQTGNLAFKLFSFWGNNHFDHLQRNNFYSLIWITEGRGLLKSDFSEHEFEDGTLMAFGPYQPFMISSKNIKGLALQFHSDFYCIHRNPKETNCDNTLFNNIYQSPCMEVDAVLGQKLNTLLTQLEEEVKNEEGDQELIVPYLKILLKELSRVKKVDTHDQPRFTDSDTPFLLRNLKKHIENHFRQKHNASEYADMLHISSDALARLVKKHYHKTLTDMITERVILEAKRELYMTSKPIKEIAWELGYSDEFYFSRLFKNKTDTSPQAYRDTVGFGKADQN